MKVIVVSGCVTNRSSGGKESTVLYGSIEPLDLEKPIKSQFSSYEEQLQLFLYV
jgi:hypothetical protein